MTHCVPAFINWLSLGLSFLGTGPVYGRRGAASLMVQWGIDQCRKDEVLAYLESTLEASSFYRKHGFVAHRNISLELDNLGASRIYTEVCFLFTPENTKGMAHA